MDAVEFDLPSLEPAPGTAVAGSGGVVDAVPPPPSPVETARAEAEAIRAAARVEGLEAGRAEAAGEIAAALTALARATEAVAGRADDLADAVEDAAVDLALRIADQVLGGALDADPALVVAVVRGALRRLVERGDVTVLVHPDDLEIVRSAAPSLVAELGGIEHLEVQSERRVARGGATVRTAEGEVDATLATKLERVREVVAAAAMPAAPAEPPDAPDDASTSDDAPAGADVLDG